jgi:hypothetical protein
LAVIVGDARYGRLLGNLRRNQIDDDYVGLAPKAEGNATDAARNKQVG